MTEKKSGCAKIEKLLTRSCVSVRGFGEKELRMLLPKGFRV